MRVDNTASDLMSILQKKVERDNDESSGPGGFASMMKQALAAGGAISIAPAPAGAASASPSAANVVTPFNAREDAEYQKFYDTVAGGGIITIPDECYEFDDNGARRLTAEGKKYIAKTRMQNAATLAPASIDEAKKLYAASSRHFGEQLNQFLTNSGYSMAVNYAVSSIDKYDNLGMMQEGKNPQPEPFIKYFHESGAIEKFNVMAEEASFYGAVASLAEKDQKFGRAYNADPQAALSAYAQELGYEMERIQLPEGRSALMPPDTRPRYRRMTSHDNPADLFAPGMTSHPVDNKYEPVFDATGAWKGWREKEEK